MTALHPREAGAFWTGLGARIDAVFGRPQAVLVASAHTRHRQPVLLAAPGHRAIYDFGGFDPQLRTLQYDAPGAPAHAQGLVQHLQAQGLACSISGQGGLDHGIWVPMRQLWPQADVPVLPLAWPADATATELWALGRAIAPWAQAERVLVLGSGSITHNLERVFAGGHMPAVDEPEATDCAAFRDWFADHGRAAQWAQLLDWARRAPHAQAMHPSDEHLLPFFLAAGASGEPAAQALRLHASITYGCLGMDSYAFGAAAYWLATDA